MTKETIFGIICAQGDEIMKKVKWKIKPITLATTVVLASGIGAVSCVRMNHKQIENIQKSIEDNHFLLDCYGSVDGNLELSKIEEKVYDE